MYFYGKMSFVLSCLQEAFCGIIISANNHKKKSLTICASLKFDQVFWFFSWKGILMVYWWKSLQSLKRMLEINNTKQSKFYGETLQYRACHLKRGALFWFPNWTTERRFCICCSLFLTGIYTFNFLRNAKYWILL